MQQSRLLWWRGVVVMVIIVVGVVVVGRPAHGVGAAGAPVLVDRAGGAYNGIEVTLAADRAPVPGEVVTLTVTARPLRDAPNLVVEWELPDGGTLDGPITESLGPVAAGESLSFTRQAEFPADGVYGVRARVRYFANEATSLAASGVLFFTVRAGGPVASDVDPRTPVYTPPPDRTTIDKSALAGPVPRAANGCFTVTGLLNRENRMPFAAVVPETPAPAVPRYAGQYQDQLGSAVPVHNILVEMREEDLVSDDSYGFTVTDANGRFTFSFCDDDGFLNDELELYYRVCAEVREGDTLIASIKNVDDQELYCWDSNVIDSEGGTVDFDLRVFKLSETQAPVFNIADALYWGWRFWNNNTANSPVMDRSVTAFWQGGAKRTGSFYSRGNTALVIADDASSTDEWDDSVIIHEWGHFADHQFSCYQNPGGAHALPGVNNGVRGNQLAFGEGYPDYYQSAARTIMPGSGSPSFYVDPDGPTVDLENMRGVTASNLDEGAIAALMWDFLDTTNDGQDTVSHGHAAIQRVYTGVDFQGNTQCDINRFLQVWRKLALPTDAATAATIVQNVNITLASLPVLPSAARSAVASVATVGVAADSGPAARPASGEDADAIDRASVAAPPLDFRWWDQVTMVVDNSGSMAGPAGAPKINTVKTIIAEQVNDLAPAPQGTEFNIYTFNAGSAGVSPLVQGKFFANTILPPVNALVANGPDAACPVPGLGALSQAITGKFDGQAWLYTDGDSFDTLRPETLRQSLNNQRVRASIVLLGGCGSPARKQNDVTGQERTYLGVAADGSQSSGIVPYMITALLSGGQFIYVAPDQLANAVDMVRAQLSHTAGAGKWSDYVSTVYTYRWDRLEPWEYQWFPAESLGQDAGQLYTSFPTRIEMPNAFPFFGDETSVVDVYEDGYIRMNPCLVAPQFCPNFGWQYLNLLERDLQWRFIQPGPNLTGESPGSNSTGPQVHVYTANFGFEWFIISTQGTADYDPSPQGFDFAYRAYQAWLNYKTGEIRFQYDKLRNDAAGAEISLIDDYLFATAGNVIVSNNDFSGATSGMGYKFTPAPPQPTRTYDVEVDPLIESVIFMQTGYSGTFAPMVVTRPDGAAVSCADTASVKCLTVSNKPGDNMVQFVQVNTNGETGVYKAVVAVGASGSGTFSFNALAATDLNVSSPGNHTLPYKTAHRFVLDLGRAADGNAVQGWLQTPAGSALGKAFTLFDDGAHGDGGAADGRFGSEMITPPAIGAAYLWVEGQIGGTGFRRSDPVPFNFQPLVVAADPPYVEGFYASGAYVGFYATNQDTAEHCYAVDFTPPDGWWVNSPYINSGVCIAPGATSYLYTYAGRDLSDQALGEIGDVTMTLIEVWDGAMTASAAAKAALFRPVAAIEFDNRQVGPIRPNGTDTVELTLNLYDDLGQSVGYSGPFNGELTATGGTVMSPTGMYDNGRLPLVFTAGTTPGTATVSALAEGGLTAETTFTLAEPEGTELTLTAAPTDLSDKIESALTVTVVDAYGNPAGGETVRLSVGDDDGDRATIAGGEMIEGATNKQGRLTATLVKMAGATGQVVVRAELLRADGTVRREASVVIYLSDAPPSLGGKVFLPVQIR